MKLHITLLEHPVRERNDYLRLPILNIKYISGQSERLKLRERMAFCLVERLSSGLHSHGAFATISAPIRSCQSFPYSVCQWAGRLSRVKLAMICGARSVPRRWSICKRRCERIHCVCLCNTRFNIHTHGKRPLYFRHFRADEAAETDVSDQQRRRKTAKIDTSGVK